MPRTDTVLAPCVTSSTGVVFGSRTAAVELPGDLLTPFGVFCLLDQQQPPGGDAFLFEGALGRYSYVGVGGGQNGRRGREPAPRLTIRGGRPEALSGFPLLSGHPVEALREALASIACER